MSRKLENEDILFPLNVKKHSDLSAKCYLVGFVSLDHIS